MVNDSNVPREQRRQRAATESEAARPILVAVDGSPATASLITVARMMVGVWQAPVCLLHVANEPVSDESLRSRLGLEPADLIGLLLDSCLGDPIAAILRVAAERESPLVVLGTYGWTADPTASMGHVAEGVLREAHCPVLLIGPEAAKRFRDRSTSPMQILMPLNGTPPTAAALSRVTRPLSQVRAVFDVLHVVSPSGTSAGEEGAFSVPRYMDQPHHAWQAWRREFASRFLHPLGIEARSIRVGVGDPGDEIVRAACDLESHLILLAWQGEFDQHAQTLRTVVSAAPCPVLVTRTGWVERGEEWSAQGTVGSPAKRQ